MGEMRKTKMKTTWMTEGRRTEHKDGHDGQALDSVHQQDAPVHKEVGG